MGLHMNNQYPAIRLFCLLNNFLAVFILAVNWGVFYYIFHGWFKWEAATSLVLSLIMGLLSALFQKMLSEILELSLSNNKYLRKIEDNQP